MVLDAVVTEWAGEVHEGSGGNYLGIVVKGVPLLGSHIRIEVTETNPFFVYGREVD